MLVRCHGEANESGTLGGSDCELRVQRHSDHVSSPGCESGERWLRCTAPPPLCPLQLCSRSIVYAYPGLVTTDGLPDTVGSASIEAIQHLAVPVHANPLLLLGEHVGQPAGTHLAAPQLFAKDNGKDTPQ